MNQATRVAARASALGLRAGAAGPRAGVRRHTTWRPGVTNLLAALDDPGKVAYFQMKRNEEGWKTNPDGDDREFSRVAENVTSLLPEKPAHHVRLSVKKVLKKEGQERIASKRRVRNVIHWIKWTRRHKISV